MLKSGVLIIPFLISLNAFGQVASQIDSVGTKITSDFSTKIETANRKIDSVQVRTNSFLSPDLSVRSLGQKVLDKQKRRLDSLHAMHEIDSVKAKLSAEVDSLRQLGQPVQHVVHKLDSVKEVGIPSYLDKVESGRQQLQSGLNGPQDKIEGAVNEKLDLFNSQGAKLANIDVNKVGIEVPALNVGNASQLPDMPEMSQQLDINAMKDKVATQVNLPDSPIANLNANGTVEKIKEGAQGLNGVTDKIQGYGTDAAKIAEGDIGDLEQVPKAIESEVVKLDDVQQFQSQSGQLDQVQNLIENAGDQNAVKNLAKDQVMDMAAEQLNHFQGKEALLKSAMSKLSKYKAKFPSVGSLSELTKRPPNPYKGRPLMERLVPGLTLQIQKGNTLLIDLNPMATYLLTNRFSIGAGWNERLSFMDWNHLVGADRVFGPRGNTAFLLKNGLSAKVELEWMNTFVPQSSQGSDGKREWIGSAFVGLKKDFKFMGMVRGNVQMLYNVWDDRSLSPYADRFNVRTGFELFWKKRNR